MVVPLVLAVLLAHASVTGQTGATQQPPSQGVQATTDKAWPPPGVERPGNGVVSPRLLKEVKPSYPAKARGAKIKGVVVMEAVVEANGSVGEVRVRQSLDRAFGLDDAAVKTLKKWRFAPGTKDGIAVPVLVEVEMSFIPR